MTAIKAYLLRLIFCGFLVSLSGALLRGKRIGRILALCGGCLLILTALRPLLRVDLSRLPDLITGLTRSQKQELAGEKNRELLKTLVEEQTVAWLEEKAGGMGLELRFSVSAREGEAGSFLPDSVTVSGSLTEGQQRALEALIEKELGIPPEKLRWRGG